MTAPIDMLTLMLTRSGKEPSRALPQRAYGDPSKSVKFQRESMDENILRQLCQDWRDWCATRRIFMPKSGGTVLGKMQGGRIGKEPDAIMDARLSYFNMAVHALVDMGDDNAECFVTFYAHQREPVKSTAYRLKISRDTYYRNVKTFAERAQRLAGSFERMQVEAKALPEVD
jgi:hypothetical protein